MQDIEQAEAFGGLFAQVQPEVAFMSRRDRMPAHRRMPVQAVDGPVAADAEASEEIAEYAVATQRRRSDQQRHKRRAKHLGSDLNRPADAADRRRGIECRADFVVNMRRAECTERGEGRTQFLCHRGGRQSSGEAGHADGIKAGVAGQLRGRRGCEKKHGPESGPREKLERVRRASEVVTVVGQP